MDINTLKYLRKLIYTLNLFKQVLIQLSIVSAAEIPLISTYTGHHLHPDPSKSYNLNIEEIIFPEQWISMNSHKSASF